MSTINAGQRGNNRNERMYEDIDIVTRTSRVNKDEDISKRVNKNIKKQAYEYAKEFINLDQNSIRAKQIKRWFRENALPLPNEYTDIEKEFNNGKGDSLASMLSKAIIGSGENTYLNSSGQIPPAKEIVYNIVGAQVATGLGKFAAGVVMNKINYSRILSESLSKKALSSESVVYISFGADEYNMNSVTSTMKDYLYNVKYSKLVRESQLKLNKESNKDGEYGLSSSTNELNKRALLGRINNKLDASGVYIDRIRDDCYLVLIRNRELVPYIDISSTRYNNDASYKCFAFGSKKSVNKLVKSIEQFVSLRYVSSDKGSIKVYTIKNKITIADEQAAAANVSPYQRDPFKRNNSANTSAVIADNTEVSETKAKSFEQLFIESKDELVNYLNGWMELKEYYNEFNMPHKLGVFLYGDPGTGKTSIAKAMCKLLGKALLVGDLDDIDRTIKVIRETPNIEDYVILFEDVDLIIGSNSKIADEDTRMTKVNKLLQLLDGSISRNTLVVATTNDKDSLPDNFLRSGRFDVDLEINHLSKDYAERLCRSYDIEPTNEILKKAEREVMNKTTKVIEIKYNPSDLQSACIKEIIDRHERSLRNNKLSK